MADGLHLFNDCAPRHAIRIEVLASAGIEVMKIPLLSLRANAYVEHAQ